MKFGHQVKPTQSNPVQKDLTIKGPMYMGDPRTKPVDTAGVKGAVNSLARRRLFNQLC